MATGKYTRKPFTVEHRTALSAAKKGMKFTEEHRKHLTDAKLGKTWTETRRESHKIWKAEHPSKRALERANSPKRGSVEWVAKVQAGRALFFATHPDWKPSPRGKVNRPKGSGAGVKHVFKDLEGRNKRVSEGLIRANLRGERNPNWISDRTKLKKRRDGRRETDSASVDWARSVKRRDGWKCQLANVECAGKMEAHHILNWIDYPNFRYDVRNGITLCHFHHPRGRKSEEALKNVLQDLVAIKTEV